MRVREDKIKEIYKAGKQKLRKAQVTNQVSGKRVNLNLFRG